MSESASRLPPSGIGKLQASDFLKGLVKSCGGLIVGIVIKLVQNKFKLPAYSEIEPLLEATAYFFLGYLGINAASNNEGQLFTKDKATLTVDAKQAEEADIPAKQETVPLPYNKTNQ